MIDSPGQHIKVNWCTLTIHSISTVVSYEKKRDSKEREREQKQKAIKTATKIVNKDTITVINKERDRERERGRQMDLVPLLYNELTTAKKRPSPSFNGTDTGPCPLAMGRVVRLHE